MKPLPKPHLKIETIEANVEDPINKWLKPSEVSAILNVDEKWLAAAREGRKGLEGPRFVKLGIGKTSPIRYPLDSLISWMKSFPLQGSTTSKHNSYISYINTGSSNELWPFVIYRDGSVEELFISINSNRFEREYVTRQIIWLAKFFVPKNLTS